MEQYIKCLYGLTIQQMEEVFRAVKRAYYIEDIVEYIITSEIIEKKEIVKVDLDYLVDKYIDDMQVGIGQIYVMEDIVENYFRANTNKFGTLNLSNL